MARFPQHKRAMLGAAWFLLLSAPFVAATHAQTETATVVVTATRMPRPFQDLPFSATIIPRAELELHPSATTDALLRSLPSVATFRRSSSLSADPTSQGLNLRGIAPSGVSRSLVLLDGVPINDPFGGWVYWRALPRLGIERIEVAPGGASALYGSFALGGVVQVLSRELGERAIAADAAYGSHDSILLGGMFSERFGNAGAAIEGELLKSGGHPVVAREQRGAIDGDAPSLHGTLNGSFTADPSPDLSIRGRIGWFHQDQNGGTELTDAGVDRLSFAAGATIHKNLDLQIYGGRGRFQQTRGRAAEDRSSERLTAEQLVVSQDAGGGVTYAANLGDHALLFGTDARLVEGESREQTTIYRKSGGAQQFFGAYAQDLYSLTADLQLVAGARLDLWRNRGGARTELEFSPRAGASWQLIDPLRFRAAAYQAFRAPTLNELYRPFQVGTVRTAANEDLRAEHLRGAELGADLMAIDGVALHVTTFLNELREPIINATLPEPLADGSARRRENLGRARIAGVETALDLKIAKRWTALLAYTFVDAVVVENANDPSLVGRRLPQDPRHRATAALSFRDDAIFSGTAQLRMIGPQFEDDANQLELGGFMLVDVLIARRLAAGFEVFGAIENVFDREYLVGRAGIDTIGAPRMIRAGLRFRN